MNTPGNRVKRYLRRPGTFMTALHVPCSSDFHAPCPLVAILHPSPKVMADLFQTQQLTWCPHPICAILVGAWNACKCSFSVQNILTFCTNPFCTGVLNAVSVIFFKSSLSSIVNFLLKFVGFKLNFLNFKHDTFSLSHPNLMAIGLTVTKPSANKCRSLCKLINKSMHANLGQTNDGIVMKLRYHRQEWVSQS